MSADRAAPEPGPAQRQLGDDVLAVRVECKAGRRPAPYAEVRQPRRLGGGGRRRRRRRRSGARRSSGGGSSVPPQAGQLGQVLEDGRGRHGVSASDARERAHGREAGDVLPSLVELRGAIGEHCHLAYTPTPNRAYRRALFCPESIVQYVRKRSEIGDVAGRIESRRGSGLRLDADRRPARARVRVPRRPGEPARVHGPVHLRLPPDAPRLVGRRRGGPLPDPRARPLDGDRDRGDRSRPTGSSRAGAGPGWGGCPCTPPGRRPRPGSTPARSRSSTGPSPSHLLDKLAEKAPGMRGYYGRALEGALSQLKELLEAEVADRPGRRRGRRSRSGRRIDCRANGTAYLRSPSSRCSRWPLPLAGCGDDEPELDVIEGEPIEADDVSYNVVISRFLNPDDTEDEGYLVGQPPPPPGRAVLRRLHAGRERRRGGHRRCRTS